MAGSKIIYIEEFLKKRKKPNSEYMYDQMIEKLIEAKKQFGDITNGIFGRAIEWLKSERNKPAQERSSDLLYAKWRYEIECAMSQDILKDRLTLLHLEFKLIKARRRVLYFYIKIGNIFPSQKMRYEPTIVKLNLHYQEAIKKLNNRIPTIEEFIKNHKTLSLCKEFLLWFRNDIKKPLAEQAKNKKYTLWQKKLYYAVSKEVSSKYLSKWERLKIFFLKLRYNM